MGFPFAKLQGAGNDFVVVEGSGREWSALAPALCDRRRGAGGDGVLVALPSERADVRMQMFNPDGTEDECGNGLRCLALYAVRRGLVSGPEFRVETLSGVKAVRVHSPTPADGGGGRGPAAGRERAVETAATKAGSLPAETAGFRAGAGSGDEVQVTADMGRARLEPASVPVLWTGETALDLALPVDGETLRASALSTGTAHTVIWGIPDEARFQRLSPLIEHHPLFPERTSVMWAEAEGPDRARVRIWERGAGETLACGTGACAVAVAGLLSGRTGREVRVECRGGVLRVEVSEGLELRLTGPAAWVYEGEWRGS
ncbi:MAG TPA: diaminopimelate epimerase [Armatimonadota bacterium]|nr:diaminopimelate epimerase [Armatimonadota bacterium]